MGFIKDEFVSGTDKRVFVHPRVNTLLIIVDFTKSRFIILDMLADEDPVVLKCDFDFNMKFVINDSYDKIPFLKYALIAPALLSNEQGIIKMVD